MARPWSSTQSANESGRGGGAGERVSRRKAPPVAKRGQERKGTGMHACSNERRSTRTADREREGDWAGADGWWR
eukprot:5560370-Prymnesium_polylepis.1